MIFHQVDGAGPPVVAQAAFCRKPPSTADRTSPGHYN
jgi:hypothetical protein